MKIKIVARLDLVNLKRPESFHLNHVWIPVFLCFQVRSLLIKFGFQQFNLKLTYSFYMQDWLNNFLLHARLTDIIFLTHSRLTYHSSLLHPWLAHNISQPQARLTHIISMLLTSWAHNISLQPGQIITVPHKIVIQWFGLMITNQELGPQARELQNVS